MYNGLDLIRHKNGRQISIMDMDGEIDISAGKWDFMFDFVMQAYPVTYFHGYRLDSFDEDFDQIVQAISAKHLSEAGKRSDLLLALNDDAFSYHRGLLQQLWEYYEFPGLIFCPDNSEEHTVVGWLTTRKQSEVNMPRRMYHFYRMAQPDVLWVDAHGSNLPWETRRSPKALEMEACKPLWLRILTQMGISWRTVS